MASPFMFKSLIFSQLLLLVSAHYGKCPPSFDCGKLGTIKFPFTNTQRPHCAVLAIHGCDGQDPEALKTIQLSNTSFKVLYVEINSIIIRDDDLDNRLRNKSRKAFSNNFTLIPPTSPLASLYNKYNITMFRCNHFLNVTLPNFFYKYTKCPDYSIIYGPLNTEKPLGFKWPSSLAPCSTIELAVRDQPTSDPFEFVTPDISVEVRLSDDCLKCLSHKTGQCQLDIEGKFYCAKEKTGKKVLIVAIAVSVVGVAVLMVLACCFRTKIFPPTYLLFWKENPTHRIIEEFLKENGPLPTARYSYSEAKKVTNSFRNKLGEGGFGCVYKGMLHDGRVVAVKVLSESKGNGEEFINEVASISTTSHVNIVRLLGFCLDGSKRALLYEFMPNGSLDKFIYEERNSLKVDRQLDCKTLYDIAIGVARGLEYLHRGCNTRILHFDIKPHNILLDEDFCPKISDFGLAKICPRKESIVSIFGARGTAGYIAPELFSRNFGGVSHKSDVYSYGMMVSEMVGQRKNINVEVDCSSEIYFPHWIYKRLEFNQDLGLRCIKNEIDEEMVRKMTSVSLWCIQTDPSHRPAMSKVVEMLEGSLEVLQIPPKPFLSSPSTTPAHLSCETL